MRRIALLLSALAVGSVAQAQLTLTGTSYTQNFDNIGSALPQGWSLRTAASATTLGTDVSTTNYLGTPAANTSWNNTTGSFKNAASANGFANYAAGTVALQTSATDRALAVRQVSNTSATFPGTDSGAAFVLQITNTTGLSSFNLTFKLQSLDSTSTRVTAWKVDYGFGATPATFTATTPTGTLTTGGNIYSNNTVTVNFGTALNNQTGPVWIRIVTLTGTTGTSNRATTGIDDFNLTWTGAGGPNYRPAITGKTPANNATNVALTDPVTVTFDRQVTGNAAGNFRIKNRTDNTTQTIAGNTVTVAGHVVTIPGVTLLNSKTYHITFDSTAIDTAGYKSYGSYDTTAWVFTTVAGSVGPVTAINESFNTSCPAGLPAGWSQYSAAGTQAWRCSNTAPDYYMSMNGGSATASDSNQDWLITPELTAAANRKLWFRTRYRFGGPNMDVVYSTNYSGTGDPNTATWTSLGINTYVAADSNTWVTKTANLPTGNLRIAFKYLSLQSTTPGSARQWDVDSVVAMVANGIGSIGSTANTLPVQVLGNASNGHVMIGFSLENSAALKVAIYDLAGRVVYMDTTRGVKGKNTLVLTPQTLQSGMYIIRVSDGTQQGIARTFIQ